MSTPPTDRLVATARIDPDDTPHEAATHVWARVVAAHDVDGGGPLAQLGVFDRVVLILRDVIGLSDAATAQVVNTNEQAIRRAHRAARSRTRLPPPGREECDAWAEVRAAHEPGDPGLLAGLVAHTQGCPRCSGAVLDHEQRPVSRVGGAIGIAAASTGATPSVAALVGALGAAAAVVTAAVTIGASVAPLPTAEPPQPVVVDADPDLPSDEEPTGGWPSAADGGTSGTADRGDGGGGPTQAPTELVEDATGTVEDATGPVTEPLDDLVGEVTDTVEDATDETEELLDGPVEESVDETTDAVDETTDAVEDATDAIEDAAELP